MSASNIYETAARQRKVFRLVQTLDRQVGYYTGEAARDEADALEKWTDAEWRGLARSARVNPPSPITRALVIAIIRSRVEFEQDDDDDPVRWFDA